LGGVVVARSRVREFWRARLEGLDHESACARVGVSVHAGWRWIRESGGVIPELSELKGRYLSPAEREEISRGLAAKLSQAEIARRLGRDPGTISREIERNHVVRERRGAHSRGSAPASTGPPRPSRRVDELAAKQDAYRAAQAQVKADTRARRPKPTKFSGHPELAGVECPRCNGQSVRLLGRLSRSATDILIRTRQVSNSSGWSDANVDCSRPRSTGTSPAVVR
jgi:transposase, IS30 family